MEEMLAYYGWDTIEDVMKDMGLGRVDAERALREMYEDDTAPEQ